MAARFREWVAEVVDAVRPRGLLYSTYEQRLLSRLDRHKLPRHVAVLADGNRRWARFNAPGESLVAGYRAGADKLLEFCGWCDEVEIPVVTLWVLSTDNLNRSEAGEIAPLLEVISGLVADLATKWRVQVVGDLGLLPEAVQDALRGAEKAGAAHTGLHVNVAVAYGGRHELTDAVRSLLKAQAAAGATIEQLVVQLTDEQIADHLYTKGQPDPDLIIRTSGEQRLSGFLLWQSAHSEFYFCEALWPDFRKVDFIRALRSYAQRERRYGR